MGRVLSHLLDSNKKWAKDVAQSDPDFFPRLSQQQNPDYLWIGCADSRVPANQIVNLEPGQLFVHRNVANLVVHTDLNCLSVIQYAVEALKVKHIIVCGHYGCGGVRAAMEHAELGLIENWLRHIQDIQQRHQAQLDAIADFDKRCNRMCELNVMDQVVNVCRTTIVREAWRNGQPLSVHGWVYGLDNGVIRDFGMCVTNPDEMVGKYETTVAACHEAV